MTCFLLHLPVSISSGVLDIKILEAAATEGILTSFTGDFSIAAWRALRQRNTGGSRSTH